MAGDQVAWSNERREGRCPQLGRALGAQAGEMQSAGEGHSYLRAPTNLGAERHSLGRRGSGLGAGDRAQLLSHTHLLNGKGREN